jgi:hypothetical protein
MFAAKEWNGKYRRLSDNNGMTRDLNLMIKMDKLNT